MVQGGCCGVVVAALGMMGGGLGVMGWGRIGVGCWEGVEWVGHGWSGMHGGYLGVGGGMMGWGKIGV